MQRDTNTMNSLDRRSFLGRAGGGLGGVALASLLHDDRLLAKETVNPLAPKKPHFAPKAKAVIQIFCPGGMSHVDTWDYKPELEKRAGKPFDPGGKLQFFASKPGKCQPSYWKFKQHGKCGRWISGLFPKLSRCVDDMAFVYSMVNKTALHGPAHFMMNTGFIFPGFPSMGAWVTYGLGSITENLPAFCVLPDLRGLPPGGPQNWSAGFLPAVHQGTTMQLRKNRPPINDLFPDPKAGITKSGEVAGRELLSVLNRRHAASREGNTELEARISAYELAAKLQLSAPEVSDLSGETEAIQKMYGIGQKNTDAFGRQCLLARRLVQRGVRFVQIWCGSENTARIKPRPNWDSHEDLFRDHSHHGPVLDMGASALIKDLKQQGMLDETLLMCCTEFGRQPAAQGGKGRDHNAGASTAWLAGGGIRGGVGYGSTDEFGFKAVDQPTYSYDLHATSLHLLGLDHTKLTFYHNGIRRRLTDVHGHVIRELLV